ncbi:MAG: GntR family transcriptional regulator [Hyphomicrobiaceae bacterium]
MPRNTIAAGAPASAQQKSSTPRYAVIREHLRKAIEAGRYEIGSTLPTEHELCQQFQTSRHTIREALRGLMELGLIERRQGSGSIVLSSATSPAFVHSIKSLSELWSYTRATRIIVKTRSVVTLKPVEARILGAPAASSWLKIGAERRTTSDGDMVCWLTLFAHVRFSDVLADLGQGTDPVYALIEARTGETVAEAVQEISACAMPREAAGRLKRKKDEPALRVIRRYLDANASPMLVAVSIHPAETFTHTLRLKRVDEVG